MFPASTHLNILIGIDVHIVMVPAPPAPAPIPTPLPHPFIGLVFDVGDYIPKFGASVFVNYKVRGCSFTNGKLGTKKHMPMPPGIAFSPKPIGHNSFNFFGSLKVKADGNLLAVSPFMIMSCNDIGVPLTLSVAPGKSYKPVPTTYAPTSASIPVPTGKPVIVGGPYVPDLAGMLMSLAMSYGFSAVFKLFGRALNALLKKVNLDCTKGLSAKLCKMFGEPVDLATGRVVYNIVDFEIQGPLPLKWERNWYSDSSYSGMLGHGAHLCFDMVLQPNYKEGVIVLILADGRMTAFPLLVNTEEQYHNRPEKMTLINKGEYFELKDHAGSLTYTFNCVGKDTYKPVKLTNINGFSIAFRYNRYARISDIKDSVGRDILLHYDTQGRLLKVTAAANTSERVLVSYQYNDNNDLCAITDALDKTTRIRYENHLMVEKTDRNGHSFYWKYDGPETGARCVHTWGDNGLLEGRIFYGKGSTTVTNSLNETTQYFFNEEKLCTKIVDALENSVEYYYTADKELYRQIDEEGDMTGYTYDARGNLAAQIFSDNARVIYLHDEEDRLTLKMDAMGLATVFTYNEKGLLRTISQAGSSPASLEYNGNNQLSLIRNSAGLVTMLEYDDMYNLCAVQSPDESRVEWVYDEWSRCTEAVLGSNAKQYYSYDGLDRVMSINKADGNTVKLQYDAYESVLLAQDVQGTIEFAYNALGFMVGRMENDDVIRVNYDAQNRLTSLVNGNKEVYRFERNQKGEVTRETGFDGSAVTIRRNRAGRIIRKDRPGKKWSEFEYDIRGRLVRAVYDDESWQTFSYNKNGQLTEAVNENSSLLLLRDESGRVIKETCDGHWVENVYDDQGKRTAVHSSLGLLLTQQYDKNGLPSNISAALKDGLEWNASFSYNELGQETERMLPGNVKRTMNYDKGGRVIAQQVSAAGRETLHKTYSWGPNRRLSRVVNELANNSVQYGHDEFGSLSWAKYENGLFDYRSPDAGGNLYKTAEKTDNKYSAGGKLLESAHAVYSYDEEGNLSQKQVKDANSAGEWNYQWKANGVLKKVTRPDGSTVQFEYDALGRRLSKTWKGQTTRWLWNGNVLVHEWNVNEKDRAGVAVGVSGEMGRAYPEPVDKLVAWIFDEGTCKPAAKIEQQRVNSVITDYLGTPIEMYDDAGKKTWQAEYDIRGKIRNRHQGEADCAFRYQGQYEDSETGLYYNRFRYYNPDEGMYISKDPLGLASSNFSFYAYARDPNKQVDPFGLELVDGDPLPPGTSLYRIGGGSPGNLGLKPQEAKLDPPGISLIRASSAEEAGNIMKEAFPKASRLHADIDAGKIASISSDEIREAGFDVIHNPTNNIGDSHARLTHPEGAAGFNPENIEKLSGKFKCP